MHRRKLGMIIIVLSLLIPTGTSAYLAPKTIHITLSHPRDYNTTITLKVNGDVEYQESSVAFPTNMSVNSDHSLRTVHVRIRHFSYTIIYSDYMINGILTLSLNILRGSHIYIEESYDWDQKFTSQ